MDSYIKQLNVSSTLSIDEAVKPCTKLLTWLLSCHNEMKSQKKLLKLNYTDIECMFKATLYLQELITRFGDALIELIPLQRVQDAKIFFTDCKTNKKRVISDLCYMIIDTHDGHLHAPILHHMHKGYADVQSEWGVIKQIDWATKVRHYNNDPFERDVGLETVHMHRLVARIFRLPTMQQIRTAFHRGLIHVGFEIWLRLFREPKHSIMYNRCYILRRMLCDMFDEGTEPACAKFLENIYVHINAEIDNFISLERFWRCLDYERFANSLIKYLHIYWSQHLPHVDPDEMQITAGNVPPALPLNIVLYITHLMLVVKSPCRIRYMMQLDLVEPAGLMIELLNKVAYVYS